MFNNSKARREIAAGWKWIRKRDPGEVAEAEEWAASHKEEMKATDRILYDSEDQYYKKTGAAGPEDVDKAQTIDREAFLTRDDRDRIYEDHDWFAFDGAEEQLRLPKGIIVGLHTLTELQREVLFRNIICGQSLSTIAADKGCSDRNLRDVRQRALKALRTNPIVGNSGSGYVDVVIRLLGVMVLLAIAAKLMATGMEALPWFRIAVIAISPFALIGAIWGFCRFVQRSTIRQIQAYWGMLHGDDKNK